MTTRRIATMISALCALSLSVTAPAQAFDDAVMASVVSVLPDWKVRPGGSSGARPEGTAVAILPGGLLATNVHVLGDAETLRIRMNDGRLVAASIVAKDMKTDLALIKAPFDIPVLAPAPRPGLAQPVCAIGNQFGLGLSVSCGVVSALNRSGTGFNEIEDFVQTDATVNPGGSGGALVDGDGRLVGVVSAIFTKQSDADIGVNFAASMDLVMRVMTDLRDHGRVVRGVLGFKAGELTEDEQATLTGVRVRSVDRAGPAFAAGLEAGDVIDRIGDRSVRRGNDLASALALFRPGDNVELRIKRAGEIRSISVTMEAAN